MDRTLSSRRYHPYRPSDLEEGDLDADTARNTMSLIELRAMRHVEPGLTIEAVVAELDGHPTPPASPSVTSEPQAAEAPSMGDFIWQIAKARRCCGDSVGPLRPQELIALLDVGCLLSWMCDVREKQERDLRSGFLFEPMNVDEASCEVLYCPST